MRKPVSVFLGIEFRWGVSNNGKDILLNGEQNEKVIKSICGNNGMV